MRRENIAVVSSYLQHKKKHQFNVVILFCETIKRVRVSR